MAADSERSDIEQEAARLIEAGFLVVPVPYRQKGPVIPGWPGLRIGREDLPRYFHSNASNLGILLGDDHGACDVDADCLEALRAGPFFLPRTDMVYGRDSKPGSHWVYRSDPPQPSRTFKDTDDTMIVELRCQTKDGRIGLQSIAPPSTHECGEKIRYEHGCGVRPANIDADILLVAVAETAAAALLARHWPAAGNGRHNTMLALSGGLARAGWDESNVEIFCRAVYHSLSDRDPKAMHRSDDEVRSTFAMARGGGEFTGWPHVAAAVGPDVVKRVIEWLALPPEAPLPHQPQRASAESPPEKPQRTGEAGVSGFGAPWPAPMKEEAFYGLAGQFVRLVEPHTEADPNFLLLMFLTYAGNILDRKCYLMAGGDAHYTNLFVCGVGPTSTGRKGSATSPVERFFTEGSFAPGLGNKLPSLASGEGLIWAIRDEVRGKVYNKQTKKYEDGVVAEAISDKRLIVNIAEFVSALQVMRRPGNTLSPVVREAYDSGYLVSPTKNSPAKATGAHVSIVAAITKEELLRTIEEVDADNGLLNRYLWSCSRRSKSLPEGGRMIEVVTSKEWQSLQGSFNRIIPTAPTVMARNEEAQDMWGRNSQPNRGAYAWLTRERFGLAGAVTARAHAHVLRLSLLYAVLDGAREVRREHLDAALAVWEYCEATARYIFGDALGDPTADAILKALRAAAAGLSRTQIRDFFHRKKKEEEITRALLVLHQKGLARFEYEETAGRSVERWFATPGPKV
jgi:hypothetical protein